MHLPAVVRRRIFYVTVVTIMTGGVIYLTAPARAPSPVVATPAPLAAPEQTAAPHMDSFTESAIAPTSPPPAVTTVIVPPQQAEVAVLRAKVEEYAVAEGDNIEAIAARFGLQTSTLLWANDLDADDILSIGQALRVPGMDGIIHVVQSGDNLWDIRETYGADYEAIVKANPDVDPTLLNPGEVILIPGGEPPSRRVVASSRGAARSGRQFDYWPAAGPLTDPFGWRIHPVYGSSHFHDGMDIGVPSGTPLRAVSGGTVSLAGRYGGYGLAVKIDHGGGVVTQYSHMSQIDVEYGAWVDSGEQIGLSGSTGTSTGPHLHFSVFFDGSPTDPEPWLP